MLKRLKTVCMTLFLLGTSAGAAFTAPTTEADDVRVSLSVTKRKYFISTCKLEKIAIFAKK